MYRIRFHLGRGENFMKWKVESPTLGKSEFVDPNKYSLHMSDCKFVNYQSTSNKIFNGYINKTPCGWIICNNLYYKSRESVSFDKPLLAVEFNPRKRPNWVIRGDTKQVIDDKRVVEMITLYNSAYIVDYNKYLKYDKLLS